MPIKQPKCKGGLDMSLKVKTRTIKRFAQIHTEQRRGWIYRGADSTFNLETSLERAQKRIDIPAMRSPGLEEAYMRAFRRHYHVYAAQLPAPTDDVQWLSLMQHHGAPTRLLDWSYSVYVAAYFAQEEGENDGAIWKLNLKWCDEQSRKRLQEAGKAEEDIKYLKYQHIEADEQAFRRLFMEEPAVDVIAAINPFQQSQRHTIQKSISLCPGNVAKSFEANLAAMSGWERNVMRLIMPKTIRLEALGALYEMGMTRAVLFPGLDGFSQSLRVYDPLIHPLQDGRGWGGFQQRPAPA